MSIDRTLRATGIAGSDIAVLLGMSDKLPYDLWLEKKHGFEPEAAEQTREQWLGHMLEKPLLNIYAHEKKCDVIYCDETQVHPDRPFQIFTPDALVKGERRGVDAKTAGWYQRPYWGDEPDELPERIQLQMHWYLSATDYDAWDIVALVAGELRYYTIERDPKLEKALLAIAEDWYRRFLVGDETPPMGRSKQAKLFLEKKYPDHKRPDMRAATPEEIVILEEYAALRAKQDGLQKQANAFKDRREELENIIRAAVADKEGVDWPGGKLTWRRTKDSTNWESMAIALLHHFIKDPAQQAEIYQEYVTKGHRRMLFTPAKT